MISINPEMSMALPWDVEAVEYDASPQGERTGVARGSRYEIHRELTNAGYSIQIGGAWERLLPSGILEMRDPNFGLGFDPATKPRHQYQVSGYILCSRCLPPEGCDRWKDDEIDEPWWEPMRELPEGTLREYWRAFSKVGVRDYEYAIQARYAVDNVAAYTPNGRYVILSESGELQIQPHNDNYVITVPDLKAARRAYFFPDRWEEKGALWQSSDVNFYEWTERDWARARAYFDAHKGDAIIDVNEWELWAEEEEVPETLAQLIDHPTVFYPQLSYDGEVNEVVFVLALGANFGNLLYYVRKEDDGSLVGINLGNPRWDTG